MAKMTDTEVKTAVNAEFDSAIGASGGDVSQERAKAWDYYMSKPFGNEVEGQSSVVTSDVADCVDGMMPSLLRIFTSAENLVDFDATGLEDEEQAEQESDYVNHVFFKQNPAFEILYTWFFDAGVQKNGIVKAWWDTSKVATSENYTGLSGEELADLLDDDELEPLEQNERVVDTVVEIPDPATGAPIQTIEKATVHDVSFRRVAKKGRVRIENVPPEEYRISADSRSIDPSGARMVGQEREETRSGLIEMGFDKELINGLAASTGAQSSSEKTARRDKSEETGGLPTLDTSMEKIEVREGFIKLDVDDDGVAELRHVIVAADEVLQNEPADRQPFHVISPQPLPHKHFGRSTADKVMDIQLINSTLHRQILDNLYHSNQPGHAVWELGIGENTLDDLLSTAVGGIKRFARPPSESYMPLTIPFTAGAAFPMIEHLERMKRDRTGVASDTEGLSPEALKNIQQTVMASATDMARMKIEAVVRIYAETGLKSLFRHIHELLLKHQDKEQVVKLRNKWVQVDPREWRSRENMTVRIGLGVGTREQNLLHLNAIWEKQAAMVSAGGLGLTVTPKNIYNTAAELVKNANLKHPELFFTDPGDKMPPPPEGDKLVQVQKQLGEAQIKIQQREQELDRERNAAQHQREMMNIQLKSEKQRDDLAVQFEKIATQLTELELKFNENVPGAKV